MTQPPFVRRTTPTGNELSAVPGTGSPVDDAAVREHNEDASYPGVSKEERDIAFGRTEPAETRGFHHYNRAGKPEDF